MICNGYESRLPKRARRQVEEGVQHDEAGGAQLPAGRKKKGKWRAEEDELLREQVRLACLAHTIRLEHLHCVWGE